MASGRKIFQVFFINFFVVGDSLTSPAGIRTLTEFPHQTSCLFHSFPTGKKAIAFPSVFSLSLSFSLSLTHTHTQRLKHSNLFPCLILVLSHEHTRSHKCSLKVSFFISPSRLKYCIQLHMCAHSHTRARTHTRGNSDVVEIFTATIFSIFLVSDFLLSLTDPTFPLAMRPRCLGLLVKTSPSLEGSYDPSSNPCLAGLWTSDF